MKYIVRFYLTLVCNEPTKEDVQQGIKFYWMTGTFEATFTSNTIPRIGEKFPLQTWDQREDYEVLDVIHEDTGKGIRIPVIILGDDTEEPFQGETWKAKNREGWEAAMQRRLFDNAGCSDLDHMGFQITGLPSNIWYDGVSHPKLFNPNTYSTL